MALQYQFDDRYEDQYWSIIRQLHLSATPETVLLGQKFYQSLNWHKRLLAVNIFNQLLIKDKTGGHAHTPYALEESQAILCEALNETNMEIIGSAICGLGHRPTPRALPHLISFASHEDASIRYHLACTLGSYDDNLAIDTLVKLATDEDDDVRNWATFELGSIHTDIDNQIIREVLWHNVFDENHDVSGEALKGLAERKDLRIIDVLKERLTPDCWVYEFDAAELMADPSLYPYLESIQKSTENEDCDSFWISCLLGAMEACKPKE